MDVAPVEQTLVVGRARDAAALDPALVTDNESIEVTEQIFEHLLTYDERSTTVGPSLATSWHISDDRRTYTFELRQGVRFHDGTAFNAEAVVFSFLRQKDTSHPYHFPDQKYEYWDSVYDNVQSVEATAEYTVRIVLDQPYAPFLQNLAMAPVSIVSPEAVKRLGRDFKMRPVGTGPFRFHEWLRGERIALVRNEGYWDPSRRAALNRLVFRVLPDARERLAALEGGSVDVVYNLLPTDLKYIQLHPELVVDKVAGMNVAYLAMNTQKPPFNERLVRLAVSHAINKSYLVKLIYQGYATQAVTPLPPSLWGHYRKIVDYAWDPNRARELLSEALKDGKYPQPIKARLFVVDKPRPYLPRPERVARAVAAQLAAIGMSVEVESRPWSDYTQAVERGDHELALHGWISDNGDPDNFLYPLLDRDNAKAGKLNRAFYKSAELHGILRWAREAIDQKERTRYYERAQELVHHDAPWVPLAHADVVVAYRNNIEGRLVHPSAHTRFQNVKKKGR
jgi:peptide/nickel transport system substrate-binding protein